MAWNKLYSWLEIKVLQMKETIGTNNITKLCRIILSNYLQTYVAKICRNLGECQVQVLKSIYFGWG